MHCPVNGHPQITRIIERYNKEKDEFKRIHLLIDLGEVIIKTHTALAVANFFAQIDSIEQDIKDFIVEKLRTPSLGTWRDFSRKVLEDLFYNHLSITEYNQLMNTASQRSIDKIKQIYVLTGDTYKIKGIHKSKDLYSTLFECLSNIKSIQERFFIPTFFSYFYDWDKKANEIITIRNSYAHGATPNDQECRNDIDKIEPLIAELLDIPWLKETKIGYLKNNNLIDFYQKPITGLSQKAISQLMKDGQLNNASDHHPYLVSNKGEILSLFPLMVVKSEETKTFLLFFNDLKHYKRKKEISLLDYYYAEHLQEPSIYEDFSKLIQYDKWSKSKNDVFSEYIRLYQETFVGRKDLLNKIDDFVHSETKDFLFIEGEPGMGKTALIANALSNEDEDLFVIKYFVQERAYSDPNHFLDYIFSSLDQFLTKKYENDLRVHISIKKGRTLAEKQDHLQQLLLKINDLMQKDEKLIICIDGINEANEELLPYVLMDFYSNVKFIYSSRPGYQYKKFKAQRRVERMSVIKLSALSSEAIRSMLYQVLNKYLLERNSPYVDVLAERSGGSPLYVKLICEELASKHIDLTDLTRDRLPSGLNELYDRMINRFSEEELGDSILNALYLFAAAQDALTRMHIQLILHISAKETEQIFMRLDEFLKESQDNHFQLFHETVREYLWKNRPDHVKYAESLIIDFCRNWDQLNGYGDSVQLYPLKHYSTHLKNRNDFAALYELCANEPFIQKQINKTGNYQSSLHLVADALSLAEINKDIPTLLSISSIAVRIHLSLRKESTSLLDLLENPVNNLEQILERIIPYDEDDKAILYTQLLYQLVRMGLEKEDLQKITEKVIVHLDKHLNKGIESFQHLPDSMLDELLTSLSRLELPINLLNKRINLTKYRVSKLCQNGHYDEAEENIPSFPEDKQIEIYDRIIENCYKNEQFVVALRFLNKRLKFVKDYSNDNCGLIDDFVMKLLNDSRYEEARTLVAGLKDDQKGRLMEKIIDHMIREDAYLQALNFTQISEELPANSKQNLMWQIIKGLSENTDQDTIVHLVFKYISQDRQAFLFREIALHLHGRMTMKEFLPYINEIGDTEIKLVTLCELLLKEMAAGKEVPADRLIDENEYLFLRDTIKKPKYSVAIQELNKRTEPDSLFSARVLGYLQFIPNRHLHTAILKEIILIIARHGETVLASYLLKQTWLVEPEDIYFPVHVAAAFYKNGLSGYTIILLEEVHNQIKEKSYQPDDYEDYISRVAAYLCKLKQPKLVYLFLKLVKDVSAIDIAKHRSVRMLLKHGDYAEAIKMYQSMETFGYFDGGIDQMVECSSKSGAFRILLTSLKEIGDYGKVAELIKAEGYHQDLSGILKDILASYLNENEIKKAKDLLALVDVNMKGVLTLIEVFVSADHKDLAIEMIEKIKYDKRIAARAYMMVINHFYPYDHNFEAQLLLDKTFQLVQTDLAEKEARAFVYELAGMLSENGSFGHNFYLLDKLLSRNSSSPIIDPEYKTKVALDAAVILVKDGKVVEGIQYFDTFYMNSKDINDRGLGDDYKYVLGSDLYFEAATFHCERKEFAKAIAYADKIFDGDYERIDCLWVEIAAEMAKTGRGTEALALIEEKLEDFEDYHNPKTYAKTEVTSIMNSLPLDSSNKSKGKQQEDVRQKAKETLDDGRIQAGIDYVQKNITGQKPAEQVLYELADELSREGNYEAAHLLLNQLGIPEMDDVMVENKIKLLCSQQNEDEAISLLKIYRNKDNLYNMISWVIKHVHDHGKSDYIDSLNHLVFKGLDEERNPIGKTKMGRRGNRRYSSGRRSSHISNVFKFGELIRTYVAIGGFQTVKEVVEHIPLQETRLYERSGQFPWETKEKADLYFLIIEYFLQENIQWRIKDWLIELDDFIAVEIVRKVISLYGDLSPAFLFQLIEILQSKGRTGLLYSYFYPKLIDDIDQISRPLKVMILTIILPKLINHFELFSKAMFAIDQYAQIGLLDLPGSISRKMQQALTGGARKDNYSYENIEDWINLIAKEEVRTMIQVMAQNVQMGNITEQTFDEMICNIVPK